MSKATHVIICGLVFPWEQKAPYVMSGHSTLGALEYNQAQDVVKCHECGDWFASIGVHAYRTHGITATTYKSERGLAFNSSLSSMNSRKAHAKSLHKRRACGEKLGKPFTDKHKPLGNGTFSPEVRNLRMACTAQLMQRARDLSIRLNRTPTATELRENGLHHAVIKKAFGLSVRDYLLSLDIKPRKIGGRVT